jgi:CubicO group peptidase (beta-lactamase class C family)
MGEALTVEGLRGVRDAALRHVGDTQVPGLVALVARGDQVHVEALGHLAIGGPPVARDSIFRIASTTKPITAVATLALVAAGLLALDEPVDRLLPELADRRVLREPAGPLADTVPAQRPITVHDLLTFTFGFGMVIEMFMADPPWPVVLAERELRLVTIGPPDPAAQPDPDTWIAGLGSLPLLAQPGERWLYNTGTQVLGVLLARAAGMPLADVLRTRVYEPLGMRTPVSSRPTRRGWPRCTARISACSTSRAATGAGRPPSVTVRPGWCPLWTTSTWWPACCWAVARRCCRPSWPRR